ncbi:hypothetical protein FPY71_01540 [Aureimonas fodinaquatilis]|uniref:Uncharacterized protein n=1 Tax=Aureimonas fodinaquatilis TaxID=2565783 RepID=A0A5B0E1J9_9HYPH|nr:hypothetical protein [Aureimonas fodinaquatilis]KAA0971841.1 hypothetical protein FPY71_01540 [Aureimonas fodinaquatilis]
MNVRWLTGIISMVLLGASILGGYFFWFYEEPRAIGPLAQEMIEQFEPSTRDQEFNAVVDAYITPEMRIAERQKIFNANGFDCFIRPAGVVGSEVLACRRPIEGRRHCDRLIYYAYQTSSGEVIESLAVGSSVKARDRAFGRCPYNPFPDNEEMVRFPHNG